MENVPLQLELRPVLPNIFGHADYNEFRATLVKIDEILCIGDLENQIVDQAMAQWITDNNKDSEFCNSKAISYQWKLLRYALRCNIARHLTREGLRPFSVRLTDSTLFQWFTRINELSSRKAASKSSLFRYSHYFDNELVESVFQQWQAETLSNADKSVAIGINKLVQFDELFMDSTCVKANIHFPVDWVLLRDGVRSLLLAIKTIRNQGLKHRMIAPAIIMRQMNKLAIEMTHTRRRRDSKKQRKAILRSMKKLSQLVSKHGERYRDLLSERWNQTTWTEKQANQVIGRINNILNQLPVALKQAHERIIGGRAVPSDEKILSLYEPDAHVIVRGKAGAEVEFGNGLLLTEQTDGIIIDWELFEDQPRSDSRLLKDTVTRIKKCYGPVSSASADRAFSSKNNQCFLKENHVYDAICPKSPTLLRERLQESRFVELQLRRSQTEGRIGIFKNVFLGRPLRSKGFLNKQLNITWCVLTHNLWVIARMALADEQIPLKKAA